MPSSSLQVLTSAVQPLSPHQSQFNTLVQQIKQQRELLSEWETAIALFHQRYQSEIVPLQRQEMALKEQLLRLFDRLADQKLAKADHAYLAMLIRNYAHAVLAWTSHADTAAELQAIINRHTENAEPPPRQAPAHQGAMAADRDSSADKLPASEEELLRQLTEEFQHMADEQEARRQAAAAARAKDKAHRQQAAQIRQKPDTEKQASQSVRAIYRKLASSLHPDREQDPQERQRKTAFMQRANQAYAAGHLLQLLELQLEVEQITAAHMAQVNSEQIEHYNQVLQVQLRELKKEVAQVQATFKAKFGISALDKLVAKKLRPLLSNDIAARKHNLMVLSRQLQIFSHDTSEFKSWLKEQRQYDNTQH